MSPTIRTAIIPAAGLGTRFLPLSKAVPKELTPIIDRPAIHYIVQEAMEAGIEHIVIVISYGKEALQEYFTPSLWIEETIRAKGNPLIADELRQFADNLTFTYVIQPEQRGLGHAVLCAKQFSSQEPFAVLLPDDLIVTEQPVLAQMIREWEKNPGNYVAVEEVTIEQISSYGVVHPANVEPVNDRTTLLQGVIEKPTRDQAPSNLGIVGRYILMPEVFDALELTTPGAIGEIQLTDGIANTLDRIPLYSYRFDATRYDCGTPLGVLQASVALALERPDIALTVKQWFLAQD